ncbi:MAG: endonuclease [Bacteroidetes bacterium QS_8_68_15]|nr:MAG: endonuclease [Bacteroidetes bacterium QS_8_68_15]
MSDLLFSIARWLVVALGLSMVGGTVLSWRRSPHWFIRGWDFPRVQIVCLAGLSAVLYKAFFSYDTWLEWGFVGLCAACAGWQFYRIFPYVPFAPKHVEETTEPADAPSSLRLVASNVLKENEQHARWLEVVRGTDPDLILAVEVNERWDDVIADALGDAYPYQVRYPQDNYYGMVLYSRLELVDPELRFIVQDDVPSIHTGVELRCGRRIYLHGVHPRPPEPLRDEDATARDAEVVIVGREIEAEAEDEQRPVVVAGDFNDVAWSHTSKLFQHVSHLLDPRKGRGFFNTFDARYPLLRFPLDHVFHSNHFKLINLELLPFVGSDHFPVSITLNYEPSAPVDQPEPQKRDTDEEEAQEKVQRAAEENREETVMRNEGAHPQREAPAHPDLNEEPASTEDNISPEPEDDISSEDDDEEDAPRP